MRNLAALIRRASDDGARYRRIRRFSQVTPKELMERAAREYSTVPWHQVFVFYQDGFREGYRQKENGPHQGGKPMRKPPVQAEKNDESLF